MLYPFITHLKPPRRAQVAIGLARSSLAIGDDRPVVSLGHGIHDGCHSGVVELAKTGCWEGAWNESRVGKRWKRVI